MNRQLGPSHTRYFYTQFSDKNILPYLTIFSYRFLLTNQGKVLWKWNARYAELTLVGIQTCGGRKNLLFAILCVKYCVWHGPKFRRHKVMTILLWQPVWRCYLMCHDQKKMQQVSRKRWKDPSMASIWLLPAWGVLVTSLRVGGI